jgi:hypothetical protein
MRQISAFINPVQRSSSNRPGCQAAAVFLRTFAPRRRSQSAAKYAPQALLRAV